MKNSGLSEKRIALLRLLDQRGIMTREQILSTFDIAYKNLVYALKNLEELEFIATFKLARGYAHYITKKGSDYVGLINFGYVRSASKQPNLATVEHNLLVNECIGKEKQYLIDNLGSDVPIRLITEREQLAEINLNLDLRGKTPTRSEKMRVRNRIPDFLFQFENNGQPLTNAYEVELSRKTKTALINKLTWYKSEKEKGIYDNILYLYDNESIKSHVQTNARDVGLKVFLKKIDFHS